MENEWCRAHSVLREEHRTLVRTDAEIAIPAGSEAVACFYGQMIQTVIRWAEEVEGKRQREAYLKLDNIWARSRFRPSAVRLIGQTREIDSRYFAVICDLTLTRGDGSREVRRSAQVWNREEETVLPVREVLRRWFGGRMPTDIGYRADGCYPENDEAVFFRNPHGNTPFSMSKQKFEKNLTKSRKKQKRPCNPSKSML